MSVGIEGAGSQSWITPRFAWPITPETFVIAVPIDDRSIVEFIHGQL
jgi:hypothetical protein